MPLVSGLSGHRRDLNGYPSLRCVLPAHDAYSRHNQNAECYLYACAMGRMRVLHNSGRAHLDVHLLYLQRANIVRPWISNMIRLVDRKVL